MAKTAILYAEDFVLAGVGKSKAEIATVIGEQAAENFILVTAKSFVASEQHPTFAEMCGEEPVPAKVPKAPKEPKEVKTVDPVPVLNEDGTHACDDEGQLLFVSVEKKTRISAVPLAGQYTQLKAFPSTNVDHPKFPIWEAIASNSTVEEAIAACPTELPARKTKGSYSFSSEFRYFLKKGFVVLGEVSIAYNDSNELTGSSEDVPASE